MKMLFSPSGDLEDRYALKVNWEVSGLPIPKEADTEFVAQGTFRDFQLWRCLIDHEDAHLLTGPAIAAELDWPLDEALRIYGRCSCTTT